jgi:hypothetical protein
MRVSKGARRVRHLGSRLDSRQPSHETHAVPRRSARLSDCHGRTCVPCAHRRATIAICSAGLLPGRLASPTGSSRTDAQNLSGSQGMLGPLSNGRRASTLLQRTGLPCASAVVQTRSGARRECRATSRSSASSPRRHREDPAGDGGGRRRLRSTMGGYFFLMCAQSFSFSENISKMS